MINLFGSYESILSYINCHVIFFHLPDLEIKKLRNSYAVCLKASLQGSYRRICFWLYSFCVCFPFLGTSVIQVTASDADDPTYGNSAKLVYSILEGQPYFSVEAQTGIIEQFISVGPHNWNTLKWRSKYIDWSSTVGYICWCVWAKLPSFSLDSS